MAIKAANQLTLVDVTDAYSVILTSEAYTFVGGTNGVAANNTCETQAVAYCGSTQCQTVHIGDITCPTGITSSVTNNDTASPTIKFTTSATVSVACEATIPVSADGITVNKKFSFAVAKTGSTGTSVTVSSTSVKYATSSNGTTAPTSGWQDTVPSVTNGQYLWTQTLVNYSDGKKTEAYSVSYKGTNGSNGSNGTSVTVSSTSVQYQAGDSGTTTPTGTWSNTVPTVNNGQFLWTKTVVNYSDGKSTTSYSVAYKGTNGTDGKDGSNGADALIVTITSSNGTVFKNSSGSTELTAHVFKGGVEQTITDAGVVANSLGQIKWYKGAETTPYATTKKVIVTAGDVENSLLYTCQLE